MGFPSCSRALVRIPPNINDPNGYYAELDLLPWASHEEIRRRVRKLLSRHHPDGPEPDSDKFFRYSEIAEVLTNDTLKRQYDSLPNGRAWIDSRVREMVDDGQAVTVKRQHRPKVAEHFDWFAVSPCRYDGFVAQRWYVALVAVAPVFSFTTTIRVLLHDDQPEWLADANILKIPRSWEPTTANAFALFAVKISPHHTKNAQQRNAQ